MKRFFTFVIRQSVAIALAVLFVLGFGVYATLQMPINLLPDINVPMVCVQVIYPGAPAQAVETNVTAKLEEGLSAIGGITKVDSYSYDNLSAVVLSFDYGTDTGEKQNDIKSKLSSMELPEGITTDIYDIDLNSEALAVLSVTSDKSEDEKSNLSDAYKAAEDMKAKLSAIDGVESVSIMGGPEKSIAVRPYGGLEIIAPLLVQTFSYGALDIPLGDVTAEGGNVHVQNNSDIKSVEDIENSPVTLPAELCTLFAGIREQIKNNATLAFLSLNDIDNPAVAENLINNSLVFPTVKSTVNSTLGSDFSDETLKFIILNSFESQTAKTVRVSDIASVEEEDNYSSYVYFGSSGVPEIIKGVTLEIYKSNGANSSAVVKEVIDVYGAYLKTDAAKALGAQITLLDDQSAFISDSIANVLVSMLIGGLLAVLVIFVFLKKVRTSLIIAVTMPLSVLAAMICLFAMGITLNMVSLGGLAVGIGMLVDNSIVVIESIQKHRDMDKPAFQAAVDGTTEVGGALLGSTLTTVCVFIPIIFSGGLTGEIFTDLSWAVIFSLALSFIVAVTVIPALYAMTSRFDGLLKGGRFKKSATAKAAVSSSAAEDAVKEEAVKEDYKNITFETSGETDGNAAEAGGENMPPESGERGAGKEKKAKKSFGERMKRLAEPRIMTAVTSFYGRILPAVLKRKIIPILSAVIIFGASIGLLFLTGTEFLPSIDKGQIEVNMTYDSGVALDEIEQDVWKFAGKIREKYADNLEYVSVSVGRNGLLALTDTGIITVQLKTNRGTENTVNEIRSMAENDADGIEGRSGISVKQIDGVVASLMSGTDDLSVTITGDDNDKLVRIADDIILELQKPENGFKDVKSSASQKAVRYNVTFDRYALAQKGIDYQTAVTTLYIGMSGYTACTASIDDENYKISISFDKSSIVTMDDFMNYVIGYETVAGAGGEKSAKAVKLREVLVLDSHGEIPHEEVDACIRRSDGKKMVSISATLPGVDTGAAGKKLLAVAQSVLSRAENAGYSFRQSGISTYLNDAFGGLAVALVISFFLLYAVMAVQFGSALKPLIIMASIPFSFTGGFLALVITRTSLNVVSFIGLIMLMGVVVNNAIVMLEKIKQLHDAGMPHFEAVQEACKVRLRPILMTTLTTILALIPLAIGIGQGAELMQPLGIVVIGGLLVGTLVTLVLVPTVYCAVHRLSAKYPEGRKKREK